MTADQSYLSRSSKISERKDHLRFDSSMRRPNRSPTPISTKSYGLTGSSLLSSRADVKEYLLPQGETTLKRPSTPVKKMSENIKVDLSNYLHTTP